MNQSWKEYSNFSLGSFMIAQLWEHVAITIVGMHLNSTQLRTLYQESKSYQTHTKMLRTYVYVYFGSEMIGAVQILLKSE
jgi:hypothetical protein